MLNPKINNAAVGADLGGDLQEILNRSGTKLAPTRNLSPNKYEERVEDSFAEIMMKMFTKSLNREICQIVLWSQFVNFEDLGSRFE